MRAHLAVVRTRYYCVRAPLAEVRTRGYFPPLRRWNIPYYLPLPGPPCGDTGKFLFGLWVSDPMKGTGPVNLPCGSVDPVNLPCGSVDPSTLFLDTPSV